MADFTALKTAIQTYIKQNGNEEITGEKLQEILLSMVTTLGDSAINDLVTALANEVAARQNADGTLQQNITNEATARGNADTALGGRIDDEATARANGDTALSTRLGSTITAENTAADQIGAEAEARAAADTALQELIDGITDNIENGYVYAGIATPSSTPATGKVFYLALTAGTYTNFGNTEVSQGINILKYNGTAWSLDAFIGIDDELTAGSNKLPKSGNVLENIIKNGSAFDLSAYNAVDGVPATYADLDAALAALSLLPAVYKQPGMSFRFVLTSDNKYMQYRLMADDWSINIEDWAIADEGVYVENSEFIYVKTDAKGKILFGIKMDGEPFFGVGCPEQIKLYIEEKIAVLPLDELIAELNTKVDKEEGKSLIDSNYASSQLTIDNPEYLQVTTDSEDKILEGITSKGVKQINLPVDTPSANIEHIENPEYINVILDKDDRILEGTKKNGDKYINNLANVPKNLIDYFRNKDTRMRISVLGDSISTFKQENYYIFGFLMHYPNIDEGVINVNDTWWKQVINQLGGVLEVNASSSGSTASSLLKGFTPRVGLLGNPDKIFVELGTNDWFNNVPIGTINYDEDNPDLSKFAPAYIDGIKHLKELYPKAEIVCISFRMTDEYANTIETIANHYGCTYIDVREEVGTQIHPDKATMFSAAGKVLSVVSSGLNYVLNRI